MTAEALEAARTAILEATSRGPADLASAVRREEEARAGGEGGARGHGPGGRVLRRAAGPELVAELLEAARSVAEASEPKLVLRDAGDAAEANGGVYMRRWTVAGRIRPDGKCEYAVYVHRFTGSDPSRRHDHPWVFASLLLAGHLVEEYVAPPGTVLADGTAAGPEGAEARRVLGPGDVVLRTPEHRHRISLGKDTAEAWTVVAVGRRGDTWGFEDGAGRIVPSTEVDAATLRRNPGRAGQA